MGTSSGSIIMNEHSQIACSLTLFCTHRLNSDVFGGERRPALPLVMGALSPILDVEEEMEITPGNL